MEETDIELLTEDVRFVILSPPQPPEEGYAEPAEVHDSIFLGSLVDAHDLDKLVSLGVTHVLNCANGVGKNMELEYKKKNMTYLAIDARDDAQYSISSNFDETFEFINDAVAAGGRVLIHCHQGINRSAAVTTHYLLKSAATDTNLLTVVKHLHQTRRFVLTNDEFRRQLAVWATDNGYAGETWKEMSPTAAFRHLRKDRVSKDDAAKPKHVQAILEVAVAEGYTGGKFVVLIESKKLAFQLWNRLQDWEVNEAQLPVGTTIEMSTGAVHELRVCVPDFRDVQACRTVCKNLMTYNVGFQGDFTPAVFFMLGVKHENSYQLPEHVSCVFEEGLDETKGRLWLSQARRSAARRR